MQTKQKLPRIRAGNTFSVRFSIMCNGEPEDLSEVSNLYVDLIDRTSKNRLKASAITVSGNTVLFTVRGEDQHYPGRFRAIVSYFKTDLSIQAPLSKRTVDAMAFEIVDSSTGQDPLFENPSQSPEMNLYGEINYARDGVGVAESFITEQGTLGFVLTDGSRIEAGGLYDWRVYDVPSKFTDGQFTGINFAQLKEFTAAYRDGRLFVAGGAVVGPLSVSRETAAELEINYWVTVFSGEQTRKYYVELAGTPYRVDVSFVCDEYVFSSDLKVQSGRIDLLADTQHEYENRLMAVEDGFPLIDQKIRSINDQLPVLSHNINSVEEQTATLLARTSSNEKNLQKLEAGTALTFENVNDSLDSHNQRINTIENMLGISSALITFIDQRYNIESLDATHSHMTDLFTDISRLFSDTSICDVSGSFERCTDARRAFSGNENLEHFNALMPSLRVSEYMFSGCTCLKTLDISSARIRDNIRMLEDCHSLTDLKLCLVDATANNAMFTNCTSLRNIELVGMVNISINISFSEHISVETMMNFHDAFKIRTNPYPFEFIIGQVNLAKLSDTQKAMFSDINITIY